jgi:D-psicose/D-tagatose/L-ribulose 3-epimerase
MEPFVQEGGQVGTDIKVWRNLAQNLDDETMNQNIANSLKFLKSKFGV